MSDEAAFDGKLLERIEDAGINASAPRQQRWLDGWLVRTSPGTAKRARCIQAVADGRLPLDERLARCLAVFHEAALKPFVRITPFSRPATLDADLADRGWQRVDDTRVMVSAGAEPGAASAMPEGFALDAIEPARFVGWIATARGSTDAERSAHADRVNGAAVPHRAMVVRDAAGEVVAGGQVVVEGDVAGLYDVMTLPAARGRGIAGALCAALMAEGRRHGAPCVYLQVDAENAAAIAVYTRLGFVDGYRYHYRTPPAAAGA